MVPGTVPVDVLVVWSHGLGPDTRRRGRRPCDDGLDGGPIQNEAGRPSLRPGAMIQGPVNLPRSLTGKGTGRLRAQEWGGGRLASSSLAVGSPDRKLIGALGLVASISLAPLGPRLLARAPLPVCPSPDRLSPQHQLRPGGFAANCHESGRRRAGSEAPRRLSRLQRPPPCSGSERRREIGGEEIEDVRHSFPFLVPPQSTAPGPPFDPLDPPRRKPSQAGVGWRVRVRPGGMVLGEESEVTVTGQTRGTSGVGSTGPLYYGKYS